MQIDGGFDVSKKPFKVLEVDIGWFMHELGKFIDGKWEVRLGKV